MMKNGFTMIELLASVVILGLLLVLTIPSYAGITRQMKNSNLDGKISEITVAAKKYGEQVKDEVKDAGKSCKVTTVDQLISLGLLESESESANQIFNPKDNTVLGGNIYICYNTKDYKLETYYTFTYKTNTPYQKGLYVVDNNKIYRVLKNSPTNGEITNTNYFELVRDLN